MNATTIKLRVLISRTTAGLKDLAERVAEFPRQRGIEPIIQTGFYPSTHDVKGMLAEHLQQCDAAICPIGTAYGSGPHDPITKAEQPVHGLKNPRTNAQCHKTKTPLPLDSGVEFRETIFNRITWRRGGLRLWLWPWR